MTLLTNEYIASEFVRMIAKRWSCIAKENFITRNIKLQIPLPFFRYIYIYINLAKDSGQEETPLLFLRSPTGVVPRSVPRTGTLWLITCFGLLAPYSRSY